jgi:valyl-tRNA synthetase
VEKELAGVMGRLNNPKFVSKASPEYVAEVQAQAAEVQDRLGSIDAKYQQVQALAAQAKAPTSAAAA